MKKLAKNYFYNVLYSLLAIITPLITAPHLARTLGSERIGVYGYVNSTILMISLFLMLGTYDYSTRQVAYVRDNPECLKKTFWNLTSIRMGLTVIGTVLYFIFASFQSDFSAYFYIYYTYVLSCCIDCTWLYIGIEDMKWAVIRNAITKLTAFVATITLIRGPEDIKLYFWIQGGSALLSSLIAYCKIGKYVGQPRVSFANFRKTLLESFVMMLPSISSTIYLQCDKIMIQLITNNSSEVAYYDYAEKLIIVPITIVTCLNSVLMPRMANQYYKGNHEYLSSLVSKAVHFVSFISFPLCLLLITVADKTIPWYLGDSFLPVVRNLRVLSIIIISNSLISISGNQFFTATNQIKIVFISQTIAAIENVLLNGLLIMHYGSFGTTIATVISSLTNLLIQYSFFCKQIRIRRFISVLIKYLLMSVLASVVTIIVTNQMDAVIGSTIVQCFVFAAVYVIECLVVKDKLFLEITDTIMRSWKKEGVK